MRSNKPRPKRITEALVKLLDIIRINQLLIVACRDSAWRKVVGGQRAISFVVSRGQKVKGKLPRLGSSSFLKPSVMRVIRDSSLGTEAASTVAVAAAGCTRQPLRDA